MKLIFHVDIDSFFPSASILLDPSLKGKIVAISGKQKRSVISSASYEARAKGIKAGMPIYKALELCSELCLVEPNFAFYNKLSTKFFDIIAEKYTKAMQVNSIDECYVDATNIYKKYGGVKKLALDMQKTILEKLGLNVSIGISKNKFLAKMSTNINKPKGITITKSSDLEKVIQSMPIQNYYGIGKKSWPKLINMGINTIEDLANAKEKDLEKLFGIRTKTLIDQANGIGDDTIDYSYNDLKGISNSLTFMEGDKDSAYDILSVFRKLCKQVADRLEVRGYVSDVISIFIKNSDHVVHSKQIKLKVPVYKEKDIWPVITNLFDELWEGQPIRLIGVGAANLKNIFEVSYQQSIFDKEEVKSASRSIIDQVNNNLSQKALTSAQDLFEKQKTKKGRFINGEITKIKG